MSTPERKVCASPTCLCETAYRTCSLWCGSVDIPAGVRCLCRHDACLGHPARGLSRSGVAARTPGVLAGPADRRQAVA
jgi:hypothetical protein